MSIYMDTIVGLSKVLVAYFVLFFIIPACVIKFDEENENFLDKMYISIIHSNIAVIIIVHILVLLKIYEPISFVISYLAVIVVYVFLRDKKELTGIGAYNETKRANMGLIVKLLDLWESELGFRGTMLKGAKTWIVNVFSTMINILKNFIYNPIESIALVAIIYIAAYVRFRHSIVNFYYGASDAYVHLAWTKYMGNNDIYRDGVYPYGYNALISALNKAFLIDPVVIIRFIGALGGMLIVLSVYYVLKRNFKGDKIIPIVGIAFYVLSTQLPQNTWRQMSALPQEYATLLFLPGLHFLNMYFKDFKKHYLYLAAEVLAISLFIHLYVGLFVVIGYIIICIVNLKSFFNITFTLRFAITMILSGVLGVLPMGIGLASGMKIHKQSAQFVIESAGTKESANTGISLFSFNEPDASLKLLVMLILVLIFISFIRIWIEKKPEKLHIVKINLSFSLMALVLYSQYRAVELGLPATMEFSRVGIFLSLVSVVVIALLLDVFDLFIKFKPIN